MALMPLNMTPSFTFITIIRALHADRISLPNSKTSSPGRPTVRLVRYQTLVGKWRRLRMVFGFVVISR